MQRHQKHEKVFSHLMVYCWTFLESAPLSLQSYPRHNTKHVSSYKPLFLREVIDLTPNSPFTFSKPTLSCASHNSNLPFPSPISLSHTINSLKITANSLTLWQELAKFSGQDLASSITDSSFKSYNHREIINTCWLYFVVSWWWMLCDLSMDFFL